MNNKKAISLEGVFVYQNQLPILHEVNFSLDSREFCYLMGKTGSGKSSFLKILYADLPLLKGKGQVVGYDLIKLKNSHIPLLRRKVGIILQDVQFFLDRSISENLRFVLKATSWKNTKKINQRIDEVLYNVNMLSKRNKSIYELSVREQKRVVIARAILNSPELIIADEPTGNLDPETSLETLQLILNISQHIHCAVLIATHDYTLIKKIPANTLKCEDGKIKIFN